MNVERRRERTEAIVRDILRHRHAWELPTPSSYPEASYDGLAGMEPQSEIRFRYAHSPSRRIPAWARGRLVQWLFRDGGMCLVLLASIIVCGLVAAMFVAR
jgi:hypothetical protein